MGAHLLVGLTSYGPDGSVEARHQLHGTVRAVTDGVVVLDHASGELQLPAEPDAYEPARPGRYRLPTGEVVTDPDYLSTWSISASSCPEAP